MVFDSGSRRSSQRGAVDLDLLIDGVLTLLLGLTALAAWFLILLVLET